MQLYSLFSLIISVFVCILSFFTIRWIGSNSLFSNVFFQFSRLNQNNIIYSPQIVTVPLVIVYCAGLAIMWKFVSLNNLPLNQNLLFSVLGGGLIVWIFGLIDDVLELPLLFRLLIQTILAATWVLADLWANIIELPQANFQIGIQVVKIIPLSLGQPVEDFLTSEEFSILAFIMWLVIMINAIKWMDRSHGVGTGISAISTLTVMLASSFIVIRTSNANIAFTLISISSLAGITAGLLLSSSGSKIISFGSSGAYFIGFIIAASGVIGMVKTLATVSIFLPYLLLVFPGIGISRKTWMKFGRRMFKERSLWITDDDSYLYLNDRMKRMGSSQHWSILLIYALVLVIGGIALILGIGQQGDTSIQVVGIVYGCIGVALFKYTMWQIRKHLR